MSFTAVLWGVLGFLGGFLAGSMWRGRSPAEPRPSRWRWSREQWAGPVVLLLALLMGVQYMVQVDRERDISDANQRTSECQTQWNTVFAKQLSIRSELASQAQANVDRIIIEVGKMVAPTDGVPPTAAAARKQNAKYRQLFIDFAEESKQIAKRREATPLPSLPDCG